jgi:hypothetical protein
MEKSKDVWAQRYVYNKSNPELPALTLHHYAEQALDAVFRLKSSIKANPDAQKFRPGWCEVLATGNTYTVRVTRCNESFWPSALDAIATGVLNVLNFLGFHSELYLTYCRSVRYELETLLLLHINFYPQIS